MTVTTYRASWLFPVATPPQRDVYLTIQAGRVVGIADRRPDGAVLDLDERANAPVAILPGLVNAHTHLEFGGLKQPLGAAGESITQWIPQVIAWRRERDATDSQATDSKADALTQNAKRAAIEASMRQIHAGGATRIGEIATQPFDSSHYTDPKTTDPKTSSAGASDAEPRVHAFLELIALAPDQNELSRQAAFTHLDPRTHSGQSAVVPGLSPHAPYTVNLELLEDAIDLSERTGARLQMHLAESQEELEFIAANQGPFREMLESVGVWEHADLPCGLRPLDYLQRLRQSSGCVVAHGNYLDDEEIALLAEHRDRLSIAYCPRTHAFFGHSPHPLLKMLKAGVNVCLGTDSLASNPDLSIFNEMRYLVARQLTSPETALQMATINGAEALGASDRGTLTVGSAAEITLIRLGESSDNAYESLFDAASEVCNDLF